MYNKVTKIVSIKDYSHAKKNYDTDKQPNW